MHLNNKIPKKLNFPIYVTKPRMPSKKVYFAALDELWKSKWLTNNGKFHKALEEKIKILAGSGFVSLTANGTLSLLLALKLAGVKPGTEVITTPFSFPATTHSIDWMNCTPVFADIDPVTGNINPLHVKSLINHNTSAILATHVYGTPCDHDSLTDICDPLNIPIVYDAAHAFGVKKNGSSILTLGRASSTSMHATKLFTTTEGGAVFMPSFEDKFFVDKLKNFGISNQDNVDYSGINMKLSELHAAFGFVGFDNLETEIKNRADLAKIYIDKLSNLKGVTIVTTGDGFTPNWSYFVIRINEVEAGISRDTLFEILKSLNIYCRKYFSPLMSETPVYRNLPSANHNFLPIAHRFAREILCLPIYGDLESSIVKKISKAILYHVSKVK